MGGLCVLLTYENIFVGCCKGKAHGRSLSAHLHQRATPSFSHLFWQNTLGGRSHLSILDTSIHSSLLVVEFFFEEMPFIQKGS